MATTATMATREGVDVAGKISCCLDCDVVDLFVCLFFFDGGLKNVSIVIIFCLPFCSALASSSATRRERESGNRGSSKDAHSKKRGNDGYEGLQHSSHSSKKRRLHDFDQSLNSGGLNLSMSLAWRQQRQSGTKQQHQDEYDVAVSRVGGVAGKLLRHISTSKQHAVAAAVFGIGELLSENITAQVIQQRGSNSSSNSNSSSSNSSKCCQMTRGEA